MHKYAGIDVGAETIKYVVVDAPSLEIVAHESIPHLKSVEPCLREVFAKLRDLSVEKIAICGRFVSHFDIKSYPGQAVLKRGLTQLYGDMPLTCVSIGCNGFGVLERRGGGADVYRENSRCSQGTGNFLRQLVERFDMDLSESDKCCDAVEHACPLSGRCPVILKTDMTHLANRGEDRREILAGVYDAICENVEALIKPSMCPKSVVLCGGVTRSGRIRRHISDFCTKRGLSMIEGDTISQFFIDALGCACLAAECGGDDIPAPEHEISRAGSHKHFDEIPPLATYLDKVTRMSAVATRPIKKGTWVYLGFDIGSTGSKAVALVADASGNNALGEVCWEGYLRTNGNPVAAANQLAADFSKKHGKDAKVVGFGVTGSGREIVGSMLSTCYGADRVYILNEIAAHAEGARAIEPRVDTIFEIGGQDAKYIRLADGRIVDAAMNEACSAGTGSFIEEQGRKFKDISSLSQLSEIALSGKRGVSLGQHCSVFMTQVIEDAVAAGIETPAILAGIYDSVILNYFYRVKGNRSVGDVVFCQGMPFCTPALAAAVVRQTQAEVIIPPNPGTIGAFGIARLARKAIRADKPLPLNTFLEAKLLERKTFVCASNKGCGGAGNHCKIDRISVQANGQKLQFTWGGACSLYDRGIMGEKLPDMAPNPFREREEAVERIVSELKPRERRSIAISDEFQLKTFFPFFAKFLYEIGLDIHVVKGGSIDDLRRGLDESNVRFCAPMQHYHGVASKMAAANTDFVFFPMMRSGRFSKQESYAAICPVVQSSPDLLAHDLKIPARRIIDPVIDLAAGNIGSDEFRKSCRALAQRLKVADSVFIRAFERAQKTQADFDAELYNIGQRAIAYAQAHSLKTVIVLGRNYTIHNNALNSNVPALLRGQGAIAIPVDCYPVDPDEPIYTNIYWSYGQINLRAATQIRKTPGQYAVWCSNYGCGPDSFNLQFFQFIMQGKPYAVIETDGHSGDAGTKTRIESFLHCVREYETLPGTTSPNDLHVVEEANTPFGEILRSKAKLLMPPLGDDAKILSAGFRSAGLNCVTLPVPTRSTLLLGRRYTTGKECLPMLITVGSLLEYLQTAPKDEKVVFFMARSNGPCRLGCYNLLDKLILKRLGYDKRVSVWSLTDTDYSEGVPKSCYVLIYAGFLACDVLMAALYDVRPTESRPGAANAIYQRALGRLIHLIESYKHPKLWQPVVAREVLGGTFFGITSLVRDAAREFAAIRTNRRVPTVCLTGEIYVRNDPGANDYIIDALESRGVRVLFAHFSEWIEYADIVNREILKTSTGVTDVVISNFMRFIFRAMRRPMAEELDWGERHDVADILTTASTYLRPELVGEEILTIGTPLHAFKRGEIQGVVSVGPLECMPSKIAESQFYHIAENDGLLSLNLALNGDPIPASVLDDFCFEVKQRFARQYGTSAK